MFNRKLVTRIRTEAVTFCGFLVTKGSLSQKTVTFVVIQLEKEVCGHMVRNGSLSQKAVTFVVILLLEKEVFHRKQTHLWSYS
uniref:Uncharacterized protein n=1 Tax=Arion vulgaris TaxID=1028688 RepID=A0A0B6ZKR4_9EUPU